MAHAIGMVRVRRVGNSNVITLPQSITHPGFRAGDSVYMTQLDDGQVLLSPSAPIVRRAAATATDHGSAADATAGPFRRS